MVGDELQRRFDDWIDNALRTSPPPQMVVAFNFNLYDGPFAADLIGSSGYDPADSDWATDEIWEASPRLFHLPKEAWGTGWQEALETASALVRNYLASGSDGALRLLSSQAVAVGFHDGDLHLVGGSAG